MSNNKNNKSNPSQGSATNNKNQGNSNPQNKQKKSRKRKNNNIDYIDRRNGVQKQRSAAAAFATGSVGKAPVIIHGKDGCTVSHRELIYSVVGSAAFTVAETFPLNPGMKKTCPWLSTMAPSWEQYRWKKLKICYYTRTGTGVPGSMMIAPDYDPADSAPLTEQIASAFIDTAEDAPWKDIECVLSPARLNSTQPFRNVRSGPLANNLDIKTYDSGNVFLVTIDGTAVNWGKVWIEYEVEFKIPQLPHIGADHVNGGLITGATSQTGANPFGTAPIVDANADGISINTASVLAILDPGDYVVTYQITGTTITAIGLTLGAGATLLSGIAAVINAAATAATVAQAIRISASNATVTFTSTAATVTGAFAYVAEGPTNAFS